MTGLQMLLFSVVLIGALLALWLIDRNKKRQMVARFADRPDMDEETFYQNYYSDSTIPKETINSTLKEISNAASVPVMKIRPTDRFKQELAPKRGWEFGDKVVEVSWFIQKKMKEAGVSESVQLNTVDELIRYIAKLDIHKKNQ